MLIARTTTELMAGFPQNFTSHQDFRTLRLVVERINTHPAMHVQEKHIADNMIRASLAFTVCFYGNLLATLRWVLKLYVSPIHPFVVQDDTNLLRLMLDLASGELATDNIRTTQGGYSPHYVAMREAAESAGIDTEAIRKFIVGMKIHHGMEFATRNMTPVMREYFVFSEFCTSRYEYCLATIALRELTLAGNFAQIANNLPTEPRFTLFREFLKTHVDLDQDSHGPLMTKLLSEVTDPTTMISMMRRFYEMRALVYDACLDEQPLY